MGFSMSFFGLFGNKASRTAEALPEHSKTDSGGHTQPIAQGAARKSARLGQRELLYGAVRDVMIRAGVLVASYRFKVLSLDAQGREYLIMMDLLKVDLVDMKRLAEVESMIVQAAKVRHDLVVAGVYWRNEFPKLPAGVDQKLGADADAPAQLNRRTNDVLTTKNGARQQAESLPQRAVGVMAKKEDVNDKQLNRNPSHNAAPDFEDTRVVSPNEYASQLSTTQYGELE